MTTTSIAAPIPRARRNRLSRHRLLVSAGVGFLLSGVAVGTWLGVDAATGGGASLRPGPAPAGMYRTWLRPLDVVGLQKQLVRAGYSIQPTGILDPVTKSALADSIRPNGGHPLSPPLAAALSGTVITARRDPAAWNRRFGLDRRTRFVERPLTGPAGQLDDNGNLRALGGES